MGGKFLCHSTFDSSALIQIRFCMSSTLTLFLILKYSNLVIPASRGIGTSIISMRISGTIGTNTCAHFNQNRRSLSPKVTTQSLFQTSQLRFKFARLFCWHALKTSLPCCSQECIALYSKSSLWLECKTVLNSDKLSSKKKARSSKLVHNDCLHLWKQRRRQTSANEGVL